MHCNMHFVATSETPAVSSTLLGAGEYHYECYRTLVESLAAESRVTRIERKVREAGERQAKSDVDGSLYEEITTCNEQGEETLYDFLTRSK